MTIEAKYVYIPKDAKELSKLYDSLQVLCETMPHYNDLSYVSYENQIRMYFSLREYLLYNKDTDYLLFRAVRSLWGVVTNLPYKDQIMKAIEGQLLALIMIYWSEDDTRE